MNQDKLLSANKNADNNDEILQWVTFKLEEETYGVVTVIDTRARFGLLAADATDNSRILIIEAEEQVIGILADSVSEVVYLRSSEIDSAPNVGTEESAKFIQGVCNRDNELLILVDLNKLLSDDEWDELSDI